ncbi:MAG: hypothetical protein ABIV50_06105 [Opitutus sp.]
MSDQATSGEPSSASATATDSAPSAAVPSGEAKPIGSFGNARGSGLSRGKRATPPAAAASTSSVSPGSYKPTSVEVITPQREYTNPFASEMPAPAPTINEPAPQAASVSTPTAVPPPENPAPVAPAVLATPPAPARVSEMFPFTPTAGNEPKPGSPQPLPPSGEKPEIKILPPAEAKRPSVSWGDGTNDEDTRPQSDQRATFRPDRREPRASEPRSPEPRAFEPREPKPFQPREQKPFQPREPREAREPRRDGNSPSRSGQNRESPRPSHPVVAPKPSGGFLGWLKGLFGGAPAEAPKPPTEARDDAFRGNNEQRNRQRGGGRGRSGFQGDNRGPRNYQPRDPRDEVQGGEGGPRSDASSDQGGGEGGYEGGGRRRRRGGRGRNRDNRGGPSSEGQQGGGAI